MCILFVYINPDPTPDTYQVILVNNRDENYSRPTEPASIWNTDPHIVAGKDAMPGREGGTWLGLSDKGKIASLLNLFLSREELISSLDLASRGFLVPDFLLGNESSLDYSKNLTRLGNVHAKYNLIMLERINGKYGMVHFNNSDYTPTQLPDGVHGFGNTLQTMAYQKVLKGREEFSQIVAKFNAKSTENSLVEGLFNLMNDEERYPDDAIIAQLGKGYPEDYLHGLSSIKVNIPTVDYGTRTTTAILVDGMGKAIFEERTMKDPSPLCKDYITNNYQFQLPSG